MINLYLDTFFNFLTNKRKKRWAKPTINILGLKNTLGKPDNLFTEEKGVVDPSEAGQKFDNDGPS